MRMINRRALGQMSLAAATVLAVSAGAVHLLPERSATAEPPITRVETFDVDLTDDRRLVGFADDVFVGRVVGTAGGTSGEGPGEVLPETQFTVQVLKAIKGTLSGRVVVNQQGGFTSAREKVLIEGDELLVGGQTYLFATRSYRERGWHTLVPVRGDVRVTSTAHLRNLERRFDVARSQQLPVGRAG
jgi:hypothetical protein